MALAKRAAKTLIGHPKPRVAPPLPLKHRLEVLTAEAECMGIELMPSQLVAGRYLYAVGSDTNWLYPEIAKIVARQNGKTEILKPHICARLRMGRRIMHSAQNRELPREVFGYIAEHMESKHAGELASRPRFANGQEEIKTRNGGRYRIVAPTRGGARGPANDDLILDEVRELETHEFPAAANPTLSASPNPQTLYLSNMGDEESLVLNALRRRAAEDRALAYLEWSAAPTREADDREGWLEANPSVGHLPGKMRNLEREYESHRLAGTMAIWETEYLCRPVVTMRERLVDEFAWMACAAALPAAVRPVMGVSMDPSGTRASAAIAWQMGDKIGLRVLYDVTGSPIPIEVFGADLRETSMRLGVTKVGFDPLTDAELAKYFKVTEPITAGRKHAGATATFATAIKASRLQWADSDPVTSDLVWTARKPHDESGAFEAVRANDDRPITAVLAAIRAVSLAATPATMPARIF